LFIGQLENGRFYSLPLDFHNPLGGPLSWLATHTVCEVGHLLQLLQYGMSSE